MRETITARQQAGDGSQPFISKSKFLAGHQCLKLLWVAYNAKDLIPEADAAQQAMPRLGQCRTTMPFLRTGGLIQGRSS